MNYRQLKRALWIRLAVIGTLYIVGISCYWPALWKQAASGVLVGAFFMGSLMQSAERMPPFLQPRQRGWQIVFSLTRIVLLAYVIVLLGHSRMLETTVVIGGFLSYKGGLLVEYLRQAWLGFSGRNLRKPSTVDASRKRTVDPLIVTP